MRRSLLAMALLCSCGIHRLLPEGPALTGAEASSFPATGQLPPPSGVRYTGGPRSDLPVLPVQIWGLHYALDVVLVSTHPDWTMHEIARVDLSSGPLWIVKDADGEGDQHVAAALPDVASWLPEIPVERSEVPLAVEDRSAGGKVELHVVGKNSAGEAFDLHFRGRQPNGAPAKRNGSTMEHSRKAVAAVLDLAGQTHGGHARLSIGGQDWALKRLLGFYRMLFVLDQYQAGFAVASFVERAVPSPGATGVAPDASSGPLQPGFQLQRPAPGDAWPTSGLESWTDDGAIVRRPGDLVTLSYAFPERDGSREWVGAQVCQWDQVAPILGVRLDRALPDLRRPFEGRAKSHFVLDVNGQAAHGTGTLEAWWTDDGPVVEMRPSAPWWLVQRPMRTRVTFQEGGDVKVEVSRID
jgi:hypothetical protein